MGGSGGGWACPEGPFGAPIPETAQVEKVSGVPLADGFVDGYGILEGPVWADGSLYVSHFGGDSVPDSRILKLTGPSSEVWLEHSGSNGLGVDALGNLVAGVHADGSITRISQDNPKEQVVLASGYQGNRFNSPNDLALRSDGNIYFSDPSWQAPESNPQNETRVYRVDPEGTVSVVDAELSQPNGVTLSLDENTLYVSGGSGVFSYSLSDLGEVLDKNTFGSGLSGSDGMGIDCAGNLYVTQGQDVVVLDSTGTEIDRITVDGVGSVTNVAFGGSDRKTLFITSLGETQALHKLTVDVPGMPY